MAGNVPPLVVFVNDSQGSCFGVANRKSSRISGLGVADDGFATPIDSVGLCEWR